MSDRTIDRVAAATPTPVARKIKGLSDRAIAWIFVAPTIFLLLAINIFPLIWTIRLSFTNYKANRINREPEFIGLRNYERILTDSDIWLNMQATAHFLFWTIFFQVLIGFTLAWLINKDGVAVVDTQFPENAKNCIDRIKEETSSPFELLLNTHHHGDHSGGNIAFKGMVKKVIAHENSKANQERVAKARDREDSASHRVCTG